MSDLALSGLATGNDYDAIIDKLVALEQQPILRYQDQISELESVKGAWRDVNSRLKNLENKLTDLKLPSTFNSRTATSSNDSAVTATANSDAIAAKYKVEVNSVALAQRIAGLDMVDSDQELGSFDSSLPAETTVKINDEDIVLKNTDTLKDVVNTINDSESGVQASIVDNHLVLESEETGLANEMTFSDSNGVLETLGIIDSGGAVVNELQAASDAEITINGIDNITSSSNEFSEAVSGMTFTVNPEAELNSTANISVARDDGKAVTAVQAFVDQYNSIADFLDTKTDYDKDTKKAGILQGDSTANMLQTRLRELATNSIKEGGKYNNLMSIGIEIDRQGEMTLDSDKFKEALAESPEEVTSLFTADADEEGYDGMATRMDSYIDKLLQTNTGVIPSRIDMYDEQIEDLNDDITEVQDRVEMVRNRYTAQFADMEEAISNMQSQQSWMMSQLASLNNTSGMSSAS